ncbi:MAG: hypothetical protein JXA89_20690 [Anaerolineae bacterium]|nr:hypothetical protein [Anaerolineae bacterium]
MMSEIAVQLKLDAEQVDQLAAAARARQRTIDQVIQTAVAEWLDRQAQIEHARDLMRELGQGLAQGPAGQPTARNHDDVLYARTRI